MKSSIRRFVVRIVTLAAACVVAVALLEGLLTLYAWFQYGSIDVHRISELDTGNTYVTDLEKHNVQFAETIYPHPWLGFVRNKKVEQAGSGWRFNNIGLVGKDFPLERDESKFTIMLTGGSVAQQFVMAGDDGKPFLETLLNEKYRFGKPVVVLDGGNGSWGQPQQAIMTLLYGDVVDAVVTLDGFNERSHFNGGAHRLERPAGTKFLDANPVAEHGMERLAAIVEANRLKKFTFDHPWRTVYFATSLLRREIDARTEVKQTQLYQMFALPEEWPSQRCTEYNLTQYRKYVRSIDALAGLHGVKRAYFIQPCPAIGKSLTEEERKVVNDVSYADEYRHMESELLTLRDLNIPIVSLTDVFADTSETVYCDPIHCGWERGKGYVGYRIMANRVAAELARLWGVEEVHKGGT